MSEARDPSLLQNLVDLQQALEIAVLGRSSRTSGDRSTLPSSKECCAETSEKEVIKSEIFMRNSIK